MCDIKDAKRNEELAELQVEDNERQEARQSYLEAASIYVLQAELQKDSKLIKEANRCYKLSKEAVGEKWDKVLTKQELARRTIEETESEKTKQHFHVHNKNNHNNEK